MNVAPTREALLATYRIQLTPEFGFEQLRSRLPYLARLGISHIYLSPCLEAVSGSAHGYDVTDPSRVRAELGGELGSEALFEACRELGLGVVMDIVPNHMAASASHNPWWRELLRWGAASPSSRYFDVDWARHDGRVLLPILGATRRDGSAPSVLELELGGAGLVLWVDGEALPIAARSVPLILSGLSGEDAVLDERVRALAQAATGVVSRGDAPGLAPIEAAERALLERLELPELRTKARAAIDAINASPERLQEVLEAQFYRLRFWRAGLEELNYRRFFDVSTLAALRVEERSVFDAVHVQLQRWLGNGALAGVRVDHPDGLKDPEQYFERLRSLVGERWLLVEKILQPGEKLPRSWPVDGTTGYDFASLATRLFVDPGAEVALTATYCRLAELPGYDYAHSVFAAKGRALRELFGAEVAALTARALPVCEAARGASGAGDVQQALLGLLTGLPVYRTYLRSGRPASDADRVALETACRHARAESPELGPLIDRLADALLGTRVTPRHDELASAFQQLSGPAMAKGLEDTIFYDDARLIALNEVGNDPARFGASVEEFHAHARHIQQHWPKTLSTLSTHDTKRSADARLRIALLSELPGEWAVRSEAWMRRARSLPGGASVDPRTLYFLLQTLVGVHPISPERLQGYLLKAAREAKAWTSWLSPDLPREARFAELVAALLADAELHAELSSFVARLEPAFVRHSLALTLLALTAPGVPDIYQGTELWDTSLADPDNRRPVDFDARERLLASIESDSSPAWTGVTASARPGCAPGPGAGHGAEKLWLIRRALWVRRTRPECFDARGAYTSLAVVGEERQRVIAFQRGTGVVVVAPRLTLSLTNGWRGTRVVLPEGRFVDVLTGEPAVSGRLEDLVARFPVALLVEG
ncbi:MAG TPA: malto-oligosyltrehalose synthase [Polyangiaceae bacterium]|nr:malto-oligosyltrehalose synthase [Polyangiaceae bacterium]